MKTKILLSTIVVSAILTTGVFAQNGQYMKMNGKNNNMSGTTMGQHNNMGKGEQMNENLLQNIEKSDLSLDEQNLILFQYSEEMLARDLYKYFSEKYPDTYVFSNISASEQHHMDAVKLLIDRYNLSVPTGYGELTSLYNSLKIEGDLGLQNALEVGVKFEIRDIEDIAKAIKNTDNEDLKMVFAHIGGASYNHLRGFLNGLSQNNYTTTIDYSKYLLTDDLNQKGSLHDVFLTKLENLGVTLSDTIKSSLLKMGESHGKNMGENDNKGKMGNGSKHGSGNLSKQSNIDTKIAKKIDTVLDLFYTKIDNTYSDNIKKLDFLNKVIAKVDLLLANEDLKETNKNIYQYLKNKINIKIIDIQTEDINIDSLLNIN